MSRTTMKTALKGRAGAFDLPSIITGVVVVGILTAGVLAAIFGVIPFAQDHGAKQDASAVRTAEGVARAKEGRFLNTAGLIAAGYLPASQAPAAAPASGAGFLRVADVAPLKVAVETDAPGTCFVAAARSAAGSVFFVTDKASNPELMTPDTNPGCLPADTVAALVESIGGFSGDFAIGAPGAVTGSPTTATTATFSWSAATRATGYLVEYRINAGAWTIKSENQPETSAVLTGAQGQSIEVRVTSLSGTQRSAESASSSITMPAAPEVVTTLTGTVASPTSARFDWTAVAGATGYTVEYKINSGNWVPKSQGLTDTSTIIDARGSDVINFRVAATNTAGTSTFVTGNITLPAPALGDWAELTGAGTAPVWRSLAASTDGSVFTANPTSTNGILTSTDSGTSWTTQAVPKSALIYKSSRDGKIIVAIDGGSLQISRDSGATWKLQSVEFSGPLGTLTSVALSDDGSRMIAGANGKMTKSADFGATWTDATDNGSKPTAPTVAISGDGQTLFYTWNTISMKRAFNATGTYPWTSFSIAASKSGLIPASTSSVFFMSIGGSLSLTLDSGVNFKELRYWTGTTGMPTNGNVALSSDGTRMAVVSGLSMWTTINKGAAWTKTTLPGSGTDTRSVAMSGDGSTIVVGEPNGHLYKARFSG